MGQSMSLAVSIGVPLAQGFLGTLLSRKQVKNWYKKLKKPKWTPPNWLFGPVWTVLYTCMGTSAWLIWRKGGFEDNKRSLTMYGVQFLLNALWTPLFFNAHATTLAFFDVAALDVVLTVTMVLFFKENKAAGSLLIPYLTWCLYATALNAKIACDNQDGGKKDGPAQSSQPSRPAQPTQPTQPAPPVQPPQSAPVVPPPSGSTPAAAAKPEEKKAA